MLIYVKGFILGLLICVPVGPVGLLCLRRTLTYGKVEGVASYLGAATVDGLYCSIAGFGVTAVSTFVVTEELWLRLAAGLVLIGVGIVMYVSAAQEKDSPQSAEGPVRAYISTFLLTLTNPIPILIFAAVFAALGVGGWKGEYTSTAMLVLGVFSGSAVWGPLLVAGLSLFEVHFEGSRVLVLKKLSGAAMAAFGVGVEVLTLFKLVV
jgi:threonine/homoserine/homoserine lactone efflux protein